MRIKQMDGSIYDSRANENLRATVAEQAATIDYLAMMADIDIPTEDKNEMGGVDDERYTEHGTGTGSTAQS